MKKRMNVISDSKVKSRKHKFFLRAAAVCMAFFITVIPVTAAGNPTGETVWGSKSYIHSVDLSQKVIKRGIDVSSWQEEIDWTKVAADADANLSFAFIRIGYPVYLEAQSMLLSDVTVESYDPEVYRPDKDDVAKTRTIQMASFYRDDCFADNIAGALDAGLDCGVYFFSRAITEAEAIAEAEWVIAELESLGYTSEDLKLPIMFDYEYEYDINGNPAGRMFSANLSSSEKTAICNAFSQTISDAGYTAGVYGNKSMFTESKKIDTTKLAEGICVWLAQYNTAATYTGDYDFWQFTDKGSVDGIDTNVDYDFGYFSVDEDEGYKLPTGEVSDVSISTLDNKMHLTWAGVDNADGYSILRADRWNGSMALIGSVDANINSFTDETTANDFEYYYKIYPYVIGSDGSKIYAEQSSMVLGSIQTTSKMLITMTDSNTNLKLRERPGTENAVVGQIPDGTVLYWRCDAKANNGVIWNKVDYTVNGKTLSGYVSSAYTKEFEFPTRIYGANRYDTAFDTADMLKQILGVEKFKNIVVATGDNFADALSGSYLAYKKDAPIILVGKKNVPVVRKYIEENLESDGTVYVLGGLAAIPESLEEELDKCGIHNVKRLFGSNRYETNIAILKEAGVDSEDLLVCTGKNFPDSLSASAAKLPILLVNHTITSTQDNYLESLHTNKYYIIGGEAAVSTSVYKQLDRMSEVERVCGASRYETSIAVAKKFVQNPESAVLAYSKNFPDGLCGGPLAMALDAPLLMTQTGNESEAESYVNEMNCYKGYVLGGEILISQDSVEQIFGSRAKKFNDSND